MARESRLRRASRAISARHLRPSPRNPGNAGSRRAGRSWARPRAREGLAFSAQEFIPHARSGSLSPLSLSGWNVKCRYPRPGLLPSRLTSQSEVLAGQVLRRARVLGSSYLGRDLFAPRGAVVRRLRGEARREGFWANPGVKAEPGGARLGEDGTGLSEVQKISPLGFLR